MKMIKIRGELYAFTEILVRRDDAVVVEIDDEQHETPVEKAVEATEPPESTETPERAAKRKSAPPVVTVVREGALTLLAPAADAALKQGV